MFKLDGHVQIAGLGFHDFNCFLGAVDSSMISFTRARGFIVQSYYEISSVYGRLAFTMFLVKELMQSQDSLFSFYHHLNPLNLLNSQTDPKLPF
jgi:hypothetical protein